MNAYDRIVSFFQLRLVMDRYSTIYRELGKTPPRDPSSPRYDGDSKFERLGGPKYGAWVRYGGNPPQQQLDCGQKLLRGGSAALGLGAPFTSKCRPADGGPGL